MIEKENFPMEDDEVRGQEDQDLNDVNPEDIETQEQLNDANLVQRIEEEDVPSDDYGDANETIDEPSRGEEDLDNFTERDLPGEVPAGMDEDDRPLSKNLLGDNPPGSEQKAFDDGVRGDMSSEQAKYIDKDIKENFRENLDKTSSEIELDKKLKKEGNN